MLRLLFYGVWPHLLYAGLLRGSGRAGRGSLEVGQRPGPAPGGSGLALPGRLFCPISQCRWLAAGALPHQRLLQYAAAPRAQPDGSELRIGVDYPGRTVYARVWRVQVGTVPLYLLDTNIEPNNQYDQDICDRLYGGDIDVRIHQEIMLGIGGVRMLHALGLRPTAYHMNEGHSAFMALERIRMLMDDEQLSYEAAFKVAQTSQMFTTHTPVPAGIDLFPADKVLHYLGHYRQRFGLGNEEFLALGRADTGDFSAPFSMAVLAIKTATFVNGVSKLHAEVSRHMFGELWRELPLSEVPIHAITNGVHARSCVAKSTQALYDRYLGPKWSQAKPKRCPLGEGLCHSRRRTLAQP
jgi:starch phosphorylase